MLDSLWSLSYLSSKYSRIASVSLDLAQLSTGGGGDGEDLPNDQVVIVVVDDSGDATIGVDLQVIWGLLLTLGEVGVDRLVCQP